MSLEQVTILITTFLRDGYLFDCLASIKENLPECSVVTIDDGYPSHEKNELVTYLPFDSGLPAKRNEGARLTKTPYILMGCDDFDFSSKDVRDGIVRLVSILDENPDIDVAGGRVNNNPYEGFLEIIPDIAIKETRLVPDGTKAFYKVDLTVNYFLARTSVILDTPWDERMKIGGEHGDWFLELKEKNKHVVWVPGVIIHEFPFNQTKFHFDYSKYRGRAKDLGHKIFLQKRNVKDYWGF
jgi:hypothetical protein